MTSPLSDSALAQIGDYLAECIGLHFPPARWRDLQRGIELAAPELGFKNAHDCAAWISGGDLAREQLDALASHLTTSETYFFRDAALFRHLQSVLLPALIEKRRARGMRLRIWCAGCCTGEEAYSLAILLHRLIPDLPDWKVSLLATDINLSCLAKARAGVYGPWSFRGSTAWNDTRFFRVGPRKNFTVRPELRSLVHFEYLNLARNDFPSLLNGTSDIDLLLCRNVLMYFEPGVAHEVFGRFSAALVDDGWLVVAPSELSLVRNDLFTAEHFETTILHQKVGFRPVAPRVRASSPVPPTPSRRPQFAPPPVSPPRTPDSIATLERAEALYAQGYSGGASAMAEVLAAMDPPNGRAMGLLARICANEGRLAEAMVWCDKAIAANRTDLSAHYLRALVLQEQGFHEEAGDALRRTLYLDPDFIIAHFKLGALAHAVGDSVASRRHWRNTAQLLARCGPQDILPESEGLSAARLLEIVGSLVESEATT